MSTLHLSGLQIHSPMHSMHYSPRQESAPSPVSPDIAAWGQWDPAELERQANGGGQSHPQLMSPQLHHYQFASQMENHLDQYVEDSHHQYLSEYPGTGEWVEGAASGYRDMIVEDEHELADDKPSGSSSRARTRQQTRSLKNSTSSSQPYPTSSPNRSRSGSFRIQIPESAFASPEPATSPFTPSSSFSFPYPSPSPFRASSVTSNTTMDPTLSVCSSSSSSAGSPPMSQASSLYGGESNLSSSRSSLSRSYHTRPSSASSSSNHRLSITSSLSSVTVSPKKGRKLSNADRKNICLYRDLHPSLKQDIIAEHFQVERSTVSKVLKNRDHWLAVDGEDELAPSLSRSQSSSYFRAPISSSSSSSVASISTPAPQPVSLPASRPASPRPLTATSDSTIAGGRYPELDNRLASWARFHALSGQVLSDQALHDKALELAAGIKGCENFKGSPSWIEGFKTRAGIVDGSFEGMAVQVVVPQEPEPEPEPQLELPEDVQDDDATPSSIPSTPARGYFGHGPDGTQSQLQAAFLAHSKPVPSPTPRSIPQFKPPMPVRRATVSGSSRDDIGYLNYSLPSSGGSAFVTAPPTSHRHSSSVSSSHHSSSTVKFDDALSSLEKALEFLTTNGQGIVTPRDLIVISDVKAKMVAIQAQQRPQPQQSWPASAAPQQRLTLGRTMSSGSVSSYGMGNIGGAFASRRTMSSTSLLSVADVMSAEERYM